ncbi:hypothetical protein TIFTF001_021526 [Ficus carica]|uniref:Uncharacterized protein n=1 Tax=Ficus carica TaxID=3494 RepID=A0AA88ACX5_FICCA|nr:hypothetical protein TIFTF001_021526 [Ficus carica]
MQLISSANYDYQLTCHDQLLDDNLISTNDNHDDHQKQLHDQVLNNLLRPTTQDPYKHRKSKGEETIVPMKSENNNEKSNPEGKENYIALNELLTYEEQKNYDQAVHHDTGVLIPINKFTAIQGLILCKSGQKYAPLQGAKARITCEATEDKNNGNGNPKLSFSIETDETDIYGLFIETFSVSYMCEVKLNIETCKVFLEAPPPGNTCKVATDVNNGKKGAQLSSVRIFNDKILYTVGPFIYASSY